MLFCFFVFQEMKSTYQQLWSDNIPEVEVKLSINVLLLAVTTYQKSWRNFRSTFCYLLQQHTRSRGETFDQCSVTCCDNIPEVVAKLSINVLLLAATTSKSWRNFRSTFCYLLRQHVRSRGETFDQHSVTFCDNIPEIVAKLSINVLLLAATTYQKSWRNFRSTFFYLLRQHRSRGETFDHRSVTCCNNIPEIVEKLSINVLLLAATTYQKSWRNFRSTFCYLLRQHARSCGKTFDKRSVTCCNNIPEVVAKLSINILLLAATTYQKSWQNLLKGVRGGIMKFPIEGGQVLQGELIYYGWELIRGVFSGSYMNNILRV